jgi:hypothetical protein
VFADVTGVLDEIIAMEYYNTAISSAVGKNGKIVSTTPWRAALRWDATIADSNT